MFLPNELSDGGARFAYHKEIGVDGIQVFPSLGLDNGPKQHKVLRDAKGDFFVAADILVRRFTEREVVADRAEGIVQGDG